MKLLLHVVCALSMFSHLRSETAVVKKLVVNSYTSMRYAMVKLLSVVENPSDDAHEVKYEVRLPKNAYITGFTMLVNDQNITAVIMRKENASKVYDNAKESALTAGMVTQRSSISDKLDVHVFGIAVNVGGKSEVEFNLRYEELLEKRGGKYRQKIYIDADHVIPELEIKCEFREKQQFQGISYITPFDEEKVDVREDEEVFEDGYYSRKVDWRPSENDQAFINTGLDRPFEVEFELNPPSEGGLVVYNSGGEFVHLFSTTCEETKIMMKQIVFVIDVSGSMKGNSIIQVKSAMRTILSQLRQYDYFNILYFNDKVKYWKTTFQQANAFNIALAQNKLSEILVADGATNINQALIDATQQFSHTSAHIDEDNGRYGHIIVFLTDGAATSGVKSPTEIRSNLRAHNFIEGKCCKSTISTIAFGKSAAVDFLKDVAIEHEGTFTIIPETDQAVDGELVQTYEGIGNPYFQDLRFSYTVGGSVLPETNVTQSKFLQYDCGSELVIGGWTQPGEKVSPTVHVDGIKDAVVFNAVDTLIEVVDPTIVTRLVAYQKVQKLLQTMDTTFDESIRRTAKQKALDLALHFSFVTPLTSLVVEAYKRKQISTGNRGGIVNSKRQNFNAKTLNYDYDVYALDNVALQDQTPNSGSTVHVITARLIYIVINIIFCINQF